MASTPVSQIPILVSQARQAFNKGLSRPIEFRKEQLKRLAKMIKENKELLEQAAHKDLRKSPYEFELSETAPLLSDIASILNEIDHWVKPTKPSVELANMLSGAQLRPEPLGVVLIIGTWNYPFQLVFMPAIGAIAAGNCIVFKPSEVAPEMSKVVAELVPKYLDNDCFKVITGSIPETTKLLEQKFDHIFYTGNGAVARVIMTAAAKYLTPVTLELGGKSPVIVADDVDPAIAAKRIMWGKFLNNGQTCIAPDYILCSKETQEKLIPEMKKSLDEFYGPDHKSSSSLGRIINLNHFKRVSKLIEADKVAIGGVTDESDLYISPTILRGVSPDSPVMQEEIFGPVLPFVNVDSVDEAIEFVNNRDKPLALYVFSKNFQILNKVVDSTSSGGVTTNDCLMHFTEPALPFGGVGPSGMGAYHGRHTFDLFSHKKPVMMKDDSYLDSIMYFRYPPYSKQKNDIAKLAVYKEPSEKSFFQSRYLLLGGVILATASYFLLF